MLYVMGLNPNRGTDIHTYIYAQSFLCYVVLYCANQSPVMG
jgi:hypothetical protein